MLSRWQWLIMQFGRRLWVRVTLFSLGALATALLAAVIGPLIPPIVPGRVGTAALENILSILASSMLAVTTFSLTTMVSAYTAATSNATPRSSRLLMDDPTTQNTLGTFIGSFIFSLVGIIMLATGAYGENGRLVLFLVTLVVIFLIVATMLRWIDYLSLVGRVGEISEKVEIEASQALRDRIENPFFGARPLRDAARDVPEGAQPICVTQIGHVRNIDTRALEAAAKAIDGVIFVLVLPGSFIDPNRPLARVMGNADEKALKRIAASFAIDNDRSFDQDPRFGLCVLAEIASRALSPGINDPGTAIDVIGRGVRVLADWAAQDNAEVDGQEQEREIECPRVFVPPLSSDDLFDDFFGPIGRDGAGLVEIQIKLQKALLALAALGSAAMEESAARHSRLALARAETTLGLEIERQKVRDLAAAFGARPEAIA